MKKYTLLHQISSNKYFYTLFRKQKKEIVLETPSVKPPNPIGLWAILQILSTEYLRTSELNSKKNNII